MNYILKPIFKQKAITIVITFSDNYCLSGAALMSSIIHTSKEEYNYDIVILEDKISEAHKLRLNTLIEKHKNFSLRFFDANLLFENNKAFVRYYFSPIVYARLFIPRLFRDFEKVIYLDADVLLLSDLTELHKVDLQDHYLAAVPDILIRSFSRLGVKSTPESGGFTTKDYLDQKLEITHPEQYFQAGVLVFNIPKILSDKKDDNLIKEIGSFSYWFLDQDILNKVFYQKVLLLPLCWNIYHGNGDTNSFVSKLGDQDRLNYLDARKNPKVIHFAGDQKPWINKNVDYYKDFYNSVKDTEWALDLETSLRKATKLSRFKSKILPLTNKIFPVGSSSRTVIRNLYHKLYGLMKN